MPRNEQTYRQDDKQLKAGKPRDLDAFEAKGLQLEIQAVWNPGQLRELGDEIIALTGYGRCHVLNTAALAHVFALSGLPRAARLTRLLDQRNHQLAGHWQGAEGAYHGYREALTGDSDDPDPSLSQG